jgi:hypothetical protein
VYRNDRFAGWQNMPANGTPFFTYGLLDYTLLRDATAEPPASPEAPASSASAGPGSSAPAAPTSGPTASTGDGSSTSGSGSSTPLLLGLVAVVAVVVVGGLVWSRRKSSARTEDE